MSDTIYEVLHKIQKGLKVQKGNYNSYGKYKYRKCEDILEALKLILPEGCVVIINDEVQIIGTNAYVKATASILYKGESVSSSSFARESFDKKGMDPAQMTGTASSYARKYALCGLLAIDDTNDSDCDNNSSDKKKNVANISEAVKRKEENTEDENSFPSRLTKLAAGIKSGDIKHAHSLGLFVDIKQDANTIGFDIDQRWVDKLQLLIDDTFGLKGVR